MNRVPRVGGRWRTSQQFPVKSMQFGAVEMLAGSLGQLQAVFDHPQRLGVAASLLA